MHTRGQKTSPISLSLFDTQNAKADHSIKERREICTDIPCIRWFSLPFQVGKTWTGIYAEWEGGKDTLRNNLKVSREVEGCDVFVYKKNNLFASKKALGLASSAGLLPNHPFQFDEKPAWRLVAEVVNVNGADDFPRH